MKKIFLIITILWLLFNSIKAQTEADIQTDVEFDFYDSKTAINFGDNIYSDFFSGTCSLTKSAKGTRSVHNYNQCSDGSSENTWYSNYIGNDCKSCKDKNKNYRKCIICDIGCLVTCCAMILRNEKYIEANPGTFNSYLQNNNGFNTCNLNFSLPNDPLANYSNKTINHTGDISYAGPADDTKVAKILKTIVDNNGYAIVKLTKLFTSGTYINVPSHFVLLYDYEGDGSDLKQYVVSDPGTSREDGTRKKLGDYYNNGIYIGAGAFRLINISQTNITPKANFSIWDKIKNAAIDLRNTAVNTLVKFMIGADPLKSGTINCNQVWVITDPSGAKSTYTTDNFDYKFTKVGTYTISLAVENANGFNAEVKTVNIVSSPDPNPNPNPPSNLDFDISPANQSFCQQITFTLKDHSLLGKVQWDFGDGTTDTPAGYTAYHSYCNGSGIYIVTSRLTNNPGVNTSKAISIPSPPTYSCKINFDYMNCNLIPINQPLYIIDRSLDYLICDSYVFNWGDGNSRRYFTEECVRRYGCDVDEPYPQNRIFSHTYTTKGYRTITETETYGNVCDNKSFSKSVIAVDCNATMTESDRSGAVYDNSGGVESYWVGYISLSNLNWIPNYNDKKVKLTACNNIKLRQGFKVKPSAGNYLKLKANEPCLSQNSLKNRPEVNMDNFAETQQPQKEAVYIYPNPSNGKFTVEFKGDISKITSFDIFNSLGHQIISKYENINQKNELDIEGAASGIYFMQINSNDKVETIKVIIE